MRRVFKTIALTGVLAMGLATVALADQFQLSQNQRISCSRGFSPGKLNTATCRSYVYLFNVTTSEYFRCAASLSLTRDAKEILNIQTDGNCVKKPRIFETDGNYTFDATETEPPNTNSFFGSGGFAIWASDTASRKLRGCLSVASGLGSDVARCIDMKFE